MNLQNNQILINYMKDRKYTECVSILKNKIVSFVIDKIKSKDNTIEFTTVSDLISVSEFYLGDSTIARALQNAVIQENVLEQINYLLSICENNGIK